MASAAEQMAANLSLANFAKATDLKKRLWFTLGALVVFRLLSFVPLPGIDPRALGSLFDSDPGRRARFLQHVLGRRLQRMSLIALGVMPYITASIVMQLADLAVAVARRAQEGRRERAQEAQPIYPLRHRLLCAIQGYFIAVGLEGWGAPRAGSAVIDPGHAVPHHRRRSAWSAAPCS